MDIINRIKSTVTTAVTGNPLSGDFDISSQKATGGPGLLWKIFDAVKRSTKQEASVFVLDKKSLERYSRRDKEFILDTLKKGVSQLTRLRHPKILSVIQPLEETRDCLAFATEPVFASLANILGQYDNFQSPVPSDLKEFQLYDVEIKYGLLQVTEALVFLHNDVKMVHCNLNPESLFINKSGNWKIAGFDCCINNANTHDSVAQFPFREWNPQIPHVVQPKLNYLAPEFTLTMTCDTASDMFSLGVLFYAIFNSGKTLYDCHGEWSTFKKNSEELRRLKISVLGSVPEAARDHVKMLLNAEPSLRPDADQISKVPFFEDVGSMTLQCLDTLIQRDNLQKSQFFKGLPKVLSKMPKRVCLQRVLPCLYAETGNPNMVPFLLPNILQIANMATQAEFTGCILPGLIPIFKIQDPMQITLIFLQNMNLLLSKTPQSDIRNHVLPMVYRSLEGSSPQIQEICLNIIPTFASLIEYSQMKSALVPKINKLCLSTTTLSLRVNCLVCLGKLLEYMDKWYVLDDILPIMQKVPSKEPAVLMSILGIYSVALNHQKLGVTKEVMAGKVLPFLLPICIDNNLNLQQFNAFIGIVKDMLQRVETEQRGKLEQLNNMQQEHRSLQNLAEKTFVENGVDSCDDKQDSMMGKFLSGFGLGNFFGPSASGSEKKSRDPLNDMSEIPVPKAEDTQLPNKPAKVSLTMEEKQRLAREQEQQSRLKQQPHLAPSQSTTPTSTKPKVKDLTSTLMTSNMMAVSRPPSSNAFPSPGSTFGGMGSAPMATNAGMRFSGPGSMVPPPLANPGPMVTGTSGFRPPAMGGMGGISTGGSMFGASPMTSQAPQKIDTSAFDNLLPSKPRAPMGQMTTHQRPAAMPQGTMGGVGMMGTGPPRAMMGNTGFMGGQSMMGNNSGMMAPRMTNSMPVPLIGQSAPQNSSSGKLTSEELADFLG